MLWTRKPTSRYSRSQLRGDIAVKLNTIYCPIGVIKTNLLSANLRNRIKPDWYLNLKEEPIVQIEIAGATFYAKAITPVGNERLQVTAILKEMIRFPDRIPRETAAVILQPLC